MKVENAAGRVTEYVVAVDAGTTGVRSLVVDRAGRIVDVAYRELPQHFPRPGWVEHDPDDIWRAVQSTLIEVAGRLSDSGGTVAAIGITNQRETALAWDRRTGTPLHRAIVWQDRRTSGRCDELRESGWLPTVRERTGLVLDPYFSATKYEWLLHHVEGTGTAQTPRGAGTMALGTVALGTVDTWVLWNLTGGVSGGVFATDVSNAARTLLLDTATLAWTPELCDIFHVPVGALAEVRPSCGRFGRVDADAVGGRASVLAGAPVSGIAGDQQAALFGQACFAQGMAKVTYGTGSFVLVNAGPLRPPPADGLLATVAWDLGDCARSGATPSGSGPGSGQVLGSSVTYALEGSAFVSGAAVQWLRDGLGIIDSVEELGPLAASVPDSGGTLMVPAFTGLGSPWWDPRARGIITGITRGTGRAQLARATLEAMAYQVRDMTDAMVGAMVGSGASTDGGGSTDGASSTGASSPHLQLRADGGASSVDLLLQLQADQSGVPVLRARSVESTALGAATLAGLAEGVWESTEELAGLWEADVELTPSGNRSGVDTAYAGWLRSVERSKGWAREARP